MDFYNVLGVQNTASQDDIRAAYRRMAMKWHPDRHDNAAAKLEAEAKFKNLQQAYDTLGDPDKRARYDAMSFDPFASMFGQSQRSGWGKQAEAQQTWEARQAEEARRYQESMPRGADVKWTARISLVQAMEGCTVDYTRKKRVTCDTCDGYGWTERICSSCNGTGQTRYAGRFITCRNCYGHGRLQYDCGDCEGKGKRSISVTSRIRIPKGVVDGSETVAKELGKESRYGGLAGDLHITVKLKPEKGFKFSGVKVEGVIKVPFTTALLGGTVVVELPTGNVVRVDIPPRTNSGKRIYLPSEGLMARDGTKGDVLLIASIVLPKSKRKLTPIEEQVLRGLDD